MHVNVYVDVDVDVDVKVEIERCKTVYYAYAGLKITQETRFE